MNVPNSILIKMGLTIGGVAVVASLLSAQAAPATTGESSFLSTKNPRKAAPTPTPQPPKNCPGCGMG